MKVALLAAIALALCACATQRLNGQLEDGYREIILLRGTTISLLQDHRLSVREATSLQGELDRIRVELDQHDIMPAQVQLDALKAYLRARQGQPL